MWIIGCDYHPRFQQIAFVDTEDGECGQRRLTHPEMAEQFYRSLAGHAVRVGMGASGHARWFERLLVELGFDLWIGNPGEIRAAAVRRRKTDARDAQRLLRLLQEGQFERMRIWIPLAADRDLRQLLWHRHRLVQMRTRVKNQLRAIALNEGLGPKPGLWSRQGRKQFEQLSLPQWTARRRQDDLELLDQLVQRTTPLDQAVLQQARQRPEHGKGFCSAVAFAVFPPVHRYQNLVVLIFLPAHDHPLRRSANHSPPLRHRR
jgi:transposase